MQSIAGIITPAPPSKGELECGVVEITPALAKAWLEKNENYRNLAPKRVRRIVEDILDDKWELNGETIKLNSDGSVKDGQHRLQAVIQADKPIRSMVVRGVVSDLCIDTGKPRSIADFLRHKGETDCRNLAAALNLLVKWEHGRLSDLGQITATAAQHVDALCRHPDIRDYLRDAKQAADIMSTSKLATVCYIGTALVENAVERTSADKFVAAVSSGEMLQKTDPAYLLRNRMLRDKASKAKLSPRETLALVIIAWNRYKYGRELSVLKWTAVGPTPQPFPEIK